MDGRVIDYETDFFAWTQSQAAALRREAEAGNPAAIDWLHLAEEVEEMGGDRRREVVSRLRVLSVHLLKWKCCPELRARCERPWRLTLIEQRDQLADLFAESPSLRRYTPEAFEAAYPRSRRVAAAEAEVPLARFPKEPPFTLEQALDPAYPPELFPPQADD